MTDSGRVVPTMALAVKQVGGESAVTFRPDSDLQSFDQIHSSTTRERKCHDRCGCYLPAVRVPVRIERNPYPLN